MLNFKTDLTTKVAKQTLVHDLDGSAIWLKPHLYYVNSSQFQLYINFSSYIHLHGTHAKHADHN